MLLKLIGNLWVLALVIDGIHRILIEFSLSFRFHQDFVFFDFIIKIIVFVRFQSLFSVDVWSTYVSSLLLKKLNLRLIILRPWKLVNFICFFQISFILLECEKIFIILSPFIKKIDFRRLFFLILSWVKCLENFLLFSSHISERIFRLVL